MSDELAPSMKPIVVESIDTWHVALETGYPIHGKRNQILLDLFFQSANQFAYHKKLMASNSNWKSNIQWAFSVKIALFQNNIENVLHCLRFWYAYKWTLLKQIILLVFDGRRRRRRRRRRLSFSNFMVSINNLRRFAWQERSDSLAFSLSCRGNAAVITHFIRTTATRDSDDLIENSISSYSRNNWKSLWAKTKLEAND